MYKFSRRRKLYRGNVCIQVVRISLELLLQCVESNNDWIVNQFVIEGF